MILGSRVLVELKSVEKILPVHEAQTILTYLRVSRFRVDFLLNVNLVRMKDDRRRFVL